MKGRLAWMLMMALLLTGCGEKRVDGPTAPPEMTTQETQAKAAETEKPIPAVTEESEAAPEETAHPETIEVPDPEGLRPIPEKLSEPKDADFVLISDYLPNAVIDLRYAGENNFTGRTIYDFEEAYLRYGTVKKLAEVSEELEVQGLYLKIWDAFRPHGAQYVLWEACLDGRYVANPQRGYSAHTRGNAVDLTLVDAEGRELEMPTGFDDFSSAADRDYSDCTEEAKANAMLLQSLMEKHGFKGYWGEWWHYTDHTQYEPEDVFNPSVFSLWTPDCEEYITLRSEADTGSEPVNRIALGEEILVLGFTGRYALAQYQAQRGYVLRNYIQPLE